jgi:hypothetical protein
MHGDTSFSGSLAEVADSSASVGRLRNSESPGPVSVAKHP